MANQYKVVIVGGGVAGLYAAWRLAVDGAAATGLTPADVLVIEGSDRTSGRLYTQPLQDFNESLPADSGLRAELGGMRFLNYHIYVGYLAKELGLPYVDFPADSGDNYHYLRTVATQLYAGQTAYTLAPQEEALLGTPAKPGTPGDILAAGLIGPVVQESWLPTSDGAVTLRDLVNNVMTASYGGVPLYEMGFWNLVVTNGQYQAGTPSVSNEAYELFADSGAYDTVPANWNAATAVVDMVADFAATPQYYALTDGYSTLSEALADRLAAAGVTVTTGTPVYAVEKSPVGGYALATGGTSFVTTDNVVLALPPRALQLITPLSVPLQQIKNQIQQSSPIPLFKIFLVYRNPGSTPWWSDTLGDGADWPQYTRMTTDLTMRQIYNFGTYTEGTGDDAVTYTLVQASYSDGLKAGYWAGLLSAEAGQAIDTGIFANLSPASGAESLGSGIVQWNDGSPVSQHPLFQRVHEQFITLLAAVAAEQNLQPPQGVDPMAGAAIDWATDPFGGGVNFWNVGVDLSTAYSATLNPVPMSGQGQSSTGTGGLFIVGEGYSLMQGWVEGALWTVEDAMAIAYPGWSAPSWLSTVPVPPPAS
jgi:glycine/D-amino acid oxidase-like deaminating enzyme